VIAPTLHATPETIFGQDVSKYPVGGQNQVPRPTNIVNTLRAADQFHARIATPIIESFETFHDGDVPTNLMFGTNIAMLSGTRRVYTYPDPTQTVLGGFPLTGTNTLGLSGGRGQFFTLAFSAPQSAFGFFGSDVEANALSLTFVSTNGTRTDIQVPVTRPQGSGGCFFIGVIDTASPFTAVEFHNNGASDDGFDLDDFTIATPQQILQPRLSIRVSQVELCWDTTSNKVYQLQFSSSLTSNAWLPLGGTVTGNGLRYCTNDAVLPDQPQRFYQLVITNSP